MEKKLIWRTGTGDRAWQSPGSGLPTGYRRILDLLAEPTSVTEVVARLGDCPAKQVRDWIDELETLCFIHASQIGGAPGFRQAA